MKRLIQILSVAVATLIVVAVLFARGIIRLNYPSLEQFPVQGVDVSHHQNHIDWEKLKGPKVKFVYIKASEGSDFRDRLFVKNWQAAQAAGIATGGYHFFTLCTPGADQARNFIEALKGVSGSQLKPVVDLEFAGNCKTRWSAEQIETELQQFVTVVKTSAGCLPMFYVTSDFYRAHIAGKFSDIPLWVRDIYRKPDLGSTPWTMWQFANRGRMPGVDTFVDLNVFQGTEADFSKLRCDVPSRSGPSNPS